MTSGPAAPAPVLVADVPLSIQQDFFRTLDRGDETGAFGAKHVVAAGWRLRGRIDADALRLAVDDVIERHEMLRTSVVRDPDNPHQQVRAATPARLLVRDIPGPRDDRDARAEVFYNEIESARYPVRELPHLRVALGRLAEDDAILVLVVQHIAADGWSMTVIIRDLATRYAARLGESVPELPPARQYREYVAAQRHEVDAPKAQRARAYWRDKLAGARITTLPAQRAATGAPGVFTDLRHLIGERIGAGVLDLAKATRSTAYMVLVAAYNVLLREKSGTDDVVAATFSASRADESFHDTVGAFLNFVPLRTDLTGCRTFLDVLTRTRRTCLEAFANELPFPVLLEQAPRLMDSAVHGTEVIGFEVLQFPRGLDGRTVGGIGYTELRRRLISQPVACDIPDGVLWALDVLPSREIVSSLKFDTNLFDVPTMWGLVEDLGRILTTVLAGPHAPMA